MPKVVTGAWVLKDWSATLPSGQQFHPYGESPRGLLHYGADGWMMVQMYRRVRPNFKGSDVMSGSLEEFRDAFLGFAAYSGRYSIDRSRRRITHLVEGSWFPNWTDTELIRYYSWDDSELLLTTEPIESSSEDLDQAQHILRWRRSE